jgi:hypothetical protein
VQIRSLMIAAVQNIRRLLGHPGWGGHVEAVYKALSADFTLILARICMLTGRLMIA